MEDARLLLVERTGSKGLMPIAGYVTEELKNLHWLHWLPVRQRVTYKLAVLTHKVCTTATPTYLSELVQTHAPPRALCSSDARCSSHTHRTGPSRFFCCCSIHLELFTCWHSTVWKHSHFQMPLENPSIQTHLVLIKRLCIFGPKGAIQIRYYYYYYYSTALHYISPYTVTHCHSTTLHLTLHTVIVQH